jgi:UDP-GlcNAc3NAcA epimerase
VTSNSDIKIVTIVGARPQFIKAAALSREIKKHPEITEIIVHTGQHFDENMSEIFFREMQIPKPFYNLNINGMNHGAMTGQMMEGIEKILLAEKPDWVLVYGDTNSTLAGTLAAKKLHIKVAHVEAGLRSFNMQMPEEINRILTDRISDLLFCPTEQAIQNLEKEGFAHFNNTIVQTGDIMLDAALFYKNQSTNNSVLDSLGLSSNRYILATIHRAENTDSLDNLKQIIGALNEINQTIPVVVPLHPRTRNILLQQNIPASFKLIDPVGYLDMIQLVFNARLIITDSGGLQKEACFFGKYCITTRTETEWVELVENGFNFITGANRDLIINKVNELKDKAYPKEIDLYGNGNAAANMCKALLSF